MTSAYGGIRWKHQYVTWVSIRKAAKPDGTTLWEKNYTSKFTCFSANKITTPLLIMQWCWWSKYVPWYQGIELYSAMRGWAKKYGCFNTIMKDHNLVEKEIKDLSIRLSQFSIIIWKVLNLQTGFCMGACCWQEAEPGAWKLRNSKYEWEVKSQLID